ncbi:hypothetical protein DL765_000991 [Monosporascus sp. GIB2]|nr:hypothetical protein DL765_000991 [Monosporascus sp. GIB2]
MASTIARRAFTTSARRLAADPALKNESKRNPELAILGGIMVLTFAGAGLYFGSSSHSAFSRHPPLVRHAGWDGFADETKGRSPTTSTSESRVGLSSSGMPWESNSAEGKYKYHPGGDPNQPPKDAPSAVNVVVVPDVNLPKRLHDKYNKWGKDGY